MISKPITSACSARSKTLIAQHSEIDRQAMDGKREDWEQAYLSTPHGQPVKLSADS